MTELEKSPVWSLLSDYGRRVVFLKNGVLGQTGQARKKAYYANATLGEAKEHGKDMYLASIQTHLGDLSPGDVYPYAAPGGLLPLREAWKDKMIAENPSLVGKTFGTPVVVSGLTSGLTLLGQLFLDPGDPVVMPDLHWENYDLIYGTYLGASLTFYPTFDGEEYNVEGMKKAILDQASRKVFVFLNFPSNPTGYMPSPQTGERITEALLECARAGKQLVVLCDDCYYGFWYADSILRESLFGHLIGLHENLLPIRLDGATKEYFAGGLRIGFVTFGSADEAITQALENKLCGAIRIAVSSSCRASQTILYHALKDPAAQAELAQKKESLVRRGKLAMSLCAQGSRAGLWKAFPFRAGYFICLQVDAQAEDLRRHLLDDYGIGVIALGGNCIRIALPCLDEEQLKYVFTVLDKAISKVRTESGLTAEGSLR